MLNDTLNVNIALLLAGYAWHYKKYDSSPILSKIENEARLQRVGLWQDPNPVEPLFVMYITTLRVYRIVRVTCVIFVGCHKIPSTK